MCVMHARLEVPSVVYAGINSQLLLVCSRFDVDGLPETGLYSGSRLSVAMIDEVPWMIHGSPNGCDRADLTLVFVVAHPSNGVALVESLEVVDGHSDSITALACLQTP